MRSTIILFCIPTNSHEPSAKRVHIEDGSLDLTKSDDEEAMILSTGILEANQKESTTITKVTTIQ